MSQTNKLQLVIADPAGVLAKGWLAAWLVIAMSLSAKAALDWPTLGFVQVTTNAISGPTSITHAGDGSQRLFVTEQAGRVRILQGSNVLAQPFLDISNKVLTSGAEQGLLSIAFPSGFVSNGQFYADYTRTPDGAIAISRFHLTSDSNVADANSEQVILTIPKSFNFHNGGQIAFGPDGYLYIGVGDGGPQGDTQLNGQKTTTLLGKLLRIDVESGGSPYAIPVSNPFVADTNYLPQIWAYGVRNPWRFSWDRLTGDFYLGDVGQNRWEEINYVPAGSPGGNNFGWRIMEGPTNYAVPAGFTNFASLTQPVAWYDHLTLPTDAAGSVTGGYVYRGPSEPRLDGVYLYGDFMAGWIWGLKQDGTNWQNFPLLRPGFGTHFWISTFGEDEQGQLYMADYNVGKIYQIVDTRQAWTPVFTPTNGTMNSNIVIVTCVTPNAEIHYTTNGLDPVLTDPFIVSGQTIVAATGLTNKARAFRADLLPSNVARAVFTNKVAAPVFSPAAGPITNGTPITISSITASATFYFTTNGSNPTTNSLLYTGPITLNGGTTLRAIGAASGFVTSAVTTVSYALAQVAMPSFNPPVGPITNGTSIIISCATPGAAIYYTLNGATPTNTSPLYQSPITLTNPATLRARAFKQAWGASTVQSVFYGFQDFESTVVTTFAGSFNSGFSNGIGGRATFYGPRGLCIDATNNLYVADSGNNVIRKILPSGMVTTLAGTGVGGAQDGPMDQAQFNGPCGVCIDQFGNLYVADSGNCYRVRKISNNGFVTTMAALDDCFLGPTLWQIEVAMDQTLYVGSYGQVFKIFQDNSFFPFAGGGNTSGDGWDLFVGVGLDAGTNVYAATQSKVWKISPDGATTLFAGSSDLYFGQGYSDGPRLLSLFQGPQDTTVDAATNVFVSDITRIRKIRPDGWVSSVAGSGVSGYKNGRSSVAQFNNVAALCVDTNSNIYAADWGNNCIRKISPDTAKIGIADDWQRLHFGLVGIDPNADPDHDGLRNFAEFWAGTDPLSAASSLVIETTSLWNSGQIQIQWKTVPGKSYVVQYSGDLATWETLGANVVGDGNLATVMDTVSIQPSDQRYYRILLANF
ncbi:MAG: PQQ-dependent sugar dehydrogenase [Verrucomicrobiota bacterium]